MNIENVKCKETLKYISSLGYEKKNQYKNLYIKDETEKRCLAELVSQLGHLSDK